jgi:hypothetical protein
MDMAASIDEVCLMNLARWRTKNRIGTALGDFGGSFWKKLTDDWRTIGKLF